MADRLNETDARSFIAQAGGQQRKGLVFWSWICWECFGTVELDEMPSDVVMFSFLWHARVWVRGVGDQLVLARQVAGHPKLHLV